MKNAKSTTLQDVLKTSADYFLEIKDPKERLNDLWSFFSCLIKIVYVDDKKIDLKLRKRITMRIIDNYNSYLE
jgi:hypothetical protein